jgi:hypothetical protein
MKATCECGRVFCNYPYCPRGDGGTQWQDENWEWRDCNVIERNGGLVYVEDAETLERAWIDFRRVR